MRDSSRLELRRWAWRTRESASRSQRAGKLGPNVEIFAQWLFDGPLPWEKLRAGQKLLSLGERYTGVRLGAAATRASRSVISRRADLLLREVGQARADDSVEVAFRRYLTPGLLVLDDFGLHPFTQQQSEDLHALMIDRTTNG